MAGLTCFNLEFILNSSVTARVLVVVAAAELREEVAPGSWKTVPERVVSMSVGTTQILFPYRRYAHE